MATKKKAPVAKNAAPAKAAPKKASKAVALNKPAARKATPKKKVVAKAPAADKTTALQKIAFLQAQVQNLKKEAVAELQEKLAEARKVVRDLEKELATLR